MQIVKEIRTIDAYRSSKPKTEWCRPNHRHGRLQVGGEKVRGSGISDEAICQSAVPNPPSLVSLGDRFALASGLMEITYDTGGESHSARPSHV